MNGHSQHNYEIYGLNITSNIEIPGLNIPNSKSSNADIDIILGALPAELLAYDQKAVKNYYIDEETRHLDNPHVVVNTLGNGKYFHFCYDDGTEFICNKEATNVWGTWAPPNDTDDTVLYLLGPILGFMLRLRGITCLHASAVVINGKAIAFTGISGAGKSTLAATFAAKGFPVLTDDVMPVVLRSGIIHAVPGYPRLRLFPEAALKLKDLPDELPRLSANEYKCYLDLSIDPYQFNADSVPLGAIYILDWSREQHNQVTEIKPMTAGDAIATLAANTYRNELLDNLMKQAEFDFLGKVISATRVKRIHQADDLEKLYGLVDLVLDDIPG